MGKSYRADSKSDKYRKNAFQKNKKKNHTRDESIPEKFDWKRIDTDQGN